MNKVNFCRTQISKTNLLRRRWIACIGGRVISILLFSPFVLDFKESVGYLSSSSQFRFQVGFRPPDGGLTLASAAGLVVQQVGEKGVLGAQAPSAAGLEHGSALEGGWNFFRSSSIGSGAGGGRSGAEEVCQKRVWHFQWFSAIEQVVVKGHHPEWQWRQAITAFPQQVMELGRECQPELHFRHRWFLCDRSRWW